MLDKKQPDLTINAAMRSEVIQGLIEKLNAYYVFPDDFWWTKSGRGVLNCGAIIFVAFR